MNGRIPVRLKRPAVPGQRVSVADVIGRAATVTALRARERAKADAELAGSIERALGRPAAGKGAPRSTTPPVRRADPVDDWLAPVPLQPGLRTTSGRR